MRHFAFRNHNCRGKRWLWRCMGDVRKCSQTDALLVWMHRIGGRCQLKPCTRSLDGRFVNNCCFVNNDIIIAIIFFDSCGECSTFVRLESINDHYEQGHRGQWYQEEYKSTGNQLLYTNSLLIIHIDKKNKGAIIKDRVLTLHYFHHTARVQIQMYIILITNIYTYIAYICGSVGNFR